MATSKIILPPCFEIKTMSEAGILFLINEEGLRTKPYLDSAGIPTIGVGNTYYENGTRVTMKDRAITKERAKSLFRTVLKTYEKAVWSSTIDTISQNNFDALTSICYNIGPIYFRQSTLLKRVNLNKDDPKISDAFMMWKYADGKPILIERRKRESELYFS